MCLLYSKFAFYRSIGLIYAHRSHNICIFTIYSIIIVVTIPIQERTAVLFILLENVHVKVFLKAFYNMQTIPRTKRCNYNNCIVTQNSISLQQVCVWASRNNNVFKQLLGQESRRHTKFSYDWQKKIMYSNFIEIKNKCYDSYVSRS